MKTTCALVIPATFVAPASAGEDNVEFKSKIQLTRADPLHTASGTFQLKRGSIHFDPDIANESGDVVVDLESGNSGGKGCDRTMHSSVLESARSPDALFSPDCVQRTLALAEAANVKVHERLSLNGAAHELTMEVHAIPNADEFWTAIDFKIPYAARGMKDPANFLLKVGNTVKGPTEGAGSLQKR